MKHFVRSLTLLVLAMVGGCSTITGDGRTVVRVATWGGAGDDSEFAKVEREIFAEFERQNPDIDIRLELIPGSQEYVRKMLLNFIARSEPEVMLLDASSAAVFVDNGVLKDLTPIIAKDQSFDLDAYFPNVVDIARRGDQVYAIPKDFTPMVLYYNRRLFDAAGVGYPKDHWTYEEFLDAAKRLTDRSRGVYGFKFANWMPGWITWIWNAGGDVLNAEGTMSSGAFDSPETQRGVEFLATLMKEGVSPSLSESAAMGVDLFTQGQAAMEISGHWALIGYAAAPKGSDGKPLLAMDDVGVAPVPTQLSASQTVMYESGWAIGKHCKRVDEAWRFVKYMTSEEVQRKYARLGLAVSARRDVAEEIAAKDPREAKFFEIVPSARPPWGAKVEKYNPVETIGQNMMDSVLKSGKPIPEALRHAANQVDKEFAK